MFFSPFSIHLALIGLALLVLVLSLGAQGLVLAEVFFFAVLHSGALLPVCALIRLVLALHSAFDIPNFWTDCVYILCRRT